MTKTMILACALAAVLTTGCQFPGFDGSRQTASLTPPAPVRPPPEERGIWIVGSAALRGPVQTASAKFGGGPDTRPRLVAEGTSAGFRAFCAGVGLEHPDMVASDRPVTPAEIKRCRAKGITLTEYVLGPKQFVYVKDAHMGAVPGVRDFVGSWGVTGKPVDEATTAS